MNQRIEPVDCCSAPVLETVGVLDDFAHSTEYVCRCRQCRSYWYRRQMNHCTHGKWEGMKFWYVGLTTEEAQKLLVSAHHANLSFLADKPGILTDGNRIEYVTGHSLTST